MTVFQGICSTVSEPFKTLLGLYKTAKSKHHVPRMNSHKHMLGQIGPV